MRLPGGLAVAVLLALPALSPGADDFVVIVHPSVAGANARRADLAAVFLRTAGRWGSGATAVPVDQSGTSPVRDTFCQAVLGMPVASAVQYWQKQMFTANQLRPPVVKGSDAEVIAFVEKTPGAVGYVSRSTVRAAGAKAIAVIE